jgi:hypothetical protein
MSVPHRYLLVWSGSNFPAVARLAVDSVLATDPVAQVQVYAFGSLPAGGDFWSMGADDRVTIVPCDAHSVFAQLPADVAAHCAAAFDAVPPSALSARSNLLRYALLYLYGGVYIDFDAIVLRPLPQLADGRDFIGAERVWRHDEARVEGRWKLSMSCGTAVWGVAWALKRMDSCVFGGRLRVADMLRAIDRRVTRLQPNNAVIGVGQHSSFMHDVLRHVRSQDPTKRYALGPHLIREVAAYSSVDVLPEVVLYPVPPAESHRWFDDEMLRLHPSTAVIHYCSSNHRGLLARLRLDDRRFAVSSAPFWSACRDLAIAARSAKELVRA